MPKPTSIFTEKQLEDFKVRCVKAKFGTVYEHWIKTILPDAHKTYTPKTSFAMWIFDANINEDEKKLEKLIGRLDKL